MESIDITSTKIEADSEIHLLPCKIVYNGDTDVKSFFSSSIMSKSEANNDNNEQQNFKIEGLAVFKIYMLYI